MDFKTVTKEYRPIPFWSWNEKLTREETKEQIRKMDAAGIGGFFMHARGGLQTEYMGEEWFDNVAASIEEAKECGMRPWAYDENGWPSGFGNGLVNGLGVEYQQKYLRMESEENHKDTAICKCGTHYFYYEINPFYVDTLDKKVIAEFLKSTYQPYYERFGNQIEGFFSDEPQISRAGIPWSFVFEEEYQKRYGENLLSHLEELFMDAGDYKHTRVKFWKMVTDLFSEAYMKQIYDWCEERGLKLTGHLVLEESLRMQLASNGACMPHYEYFHIPGMDWLGRGIHTCLVTYQVASAAEQLGKEAVLSETFACCGHNVSFAELKGIYEWQLVHGINLLCQHLEGYSIRGIRKRDYPPAMYIQQPWWEEYDRFNDAMSRESRILREGEHKVEVLVLHPQTTAWAKYHCDGQEQALVELQDQFVDQLKALERRHIEFHLGDETLMERHGRVENGRLIIGKQSYSYVIDPGCEILLDNTVSLLEEFKRTGGHIVSVEDLPANNIIDNETITYAKRCFPDYDVHYFVNTSPERKGAVVAVTGKAIDIDTGELKAFEGTHEFEPWGSLMIVEEKNTAQNEETGSGASEIAKSAETLIKVPDKLKVAKRIQNCLTLDHCDYYFDGELQEKNGYVLNICERANGLGRAVQIHQDYHVNAEYIPDELYLVCETPEQFRIIINGAEIEKNVEGYFADKSFRTIEIARYLKPGENIISFDCDFRQSDELYENLKKAAVFESEKNKLAYDMEIEAIYLLGEFCVRTDGEWTALEKNAVRYKGGFTLVPPKTELAPKNIEQQGYPFFCGTMTLEGELAITGEKPVLDIDWKGINVLKVTINGIEKTMLTDNRLTLADFQVQGKVKAAFTLTNNLRNLLGPHHLKIGESYGVGPGSFFKEPCIWNGNPEPGWCEDYCFAEMGI
ncbi:MAG: hypothetical protein J6B85_00250 [Lachnospiraceae bacterium]|nr:hypothetical protein [Lachnospiraceae bacterium]